MKTGLSSISTVGLAPWTGDQSEAMPLSTQLNTDRTTANTTPVSEGPQIQGPPQSAEQQYYLYLGTSQRNPSTAAVGIQHHRTFKTRRRLIAQERNELIHVSNISAR
jgi:hypothetical protein